MKTAIKKKVLRNNLNEQKSSKRIKLESFDAGDSLPRDKENRTYISQPK